MPKESSESQRSSEQESKSSQAEILLQDQTIQEGLRQAFSELDNLYAGIAEKTPYKRTTFPPSITPDGTFIEASKIALPLPPRPEGNIDDEYLDRVKEHRDSAEYLVFKFNLSELKSPDFQLKPMAVETTTEHRGSGIDITERNSDDPKPSFSQDGRDTNGEYYTDERFDEIAASIDAWRDRNVVHLPQGDWDVVKLGTIPAEPLKSVRERAGVKL